MFGLHQGQLAPLTDEELITKSELDRSVFHDILTELKRRKEISLLGDGLHFSNRVLIALSEKVNAFFGEGQQELATSDFKTLANNVSRKFAIPLLEWLDAQGVTKRQGNVRVKPN